MTPMYVCLITGDLALQLKYFSIRLQEPSGARPSGDAFEDVLYGSESELEESDDDEPSASTSRTAKKKDHVGARLRADDDDPMDLLTGASSRITSKYLLS